MGIDLSSRGPALAALSGVLSLSALPPAAPFSSGASEPETRPLVVPHDDGPTSPLIDLKSLRVPESSLTLFEIPQSLEKLLLARTPESMPTPEELARLTGFSVVYATRDSRHAGEKGADTREEVALLITGQDEIRVLDYDALEELGRDLDRTADSLRKGLSDPDSDVTTDQYINIAFLRFRSPESGQFARAETAGKLNAAYTIREALDREPPSVIDLEGDRYSLDPDRCVLLSIEEVVDTYLKLAIDRGLVEPGTHQKSRNLVEFQLSQSYPIESLRGADMAFSFDSPTQRGATVVLANGEQQVARGSLSPQRVSAMSRELELILAGADGRGLLITNFADVIRSATSMQR